MLIKEFIRNFFGYELFEFYILIKNKTVKFYTFYKKDASYFYSFEKVYNINLSMEKILNIIQDKKICLSYLNYYNSFCKTILNIRNEDKPLYLIEKDINFKFKNNYKEDIFFSDDLKIDGECNMTLTLVYLSNDDYINIQKKKII